MSYKCVGCDKTTGWDGIGAFSYTCLCGATILYNDETGNLAPTYSFVRNPQAGIPLPHLNDLVGESTHTSSTKEQLIKELRDRGYIWMEECEQCQRDGTLKRKQEREKHLATVEAEAIIRSSYLL